MRLATAAEYALLLTDPGPPQPAAPDPGTLSARERELVTLVAQGRTNAQIAAQLYISVRTVGSHLDRIRDKTGCRRRADLTRLALAAGLVWPGPSPVLARMAEEQRAAQNVPFCMGLRSSGVSSGVAPDDGGYLRVGCRFRRHRL